MLPLCPPTVYAMAVVLLHDYHERASSDHAHNHTEDHNQSP